jgi:hypothetical protein
MVPVALLSGEQDLDGQLEQSAGEPPPSAEGPFMTSWPAGDSARIAESDDLRFAAFRDDGTTYGTPTWIWSVAAGEAYRVTCADSPYLGPMISNPAKVRTLRITPRADA